MSLISDNLNKTLQRYGISNVWLGLETGIDSKMISKIKNGRTNCQIDNFEKLFKALPSDAQIYFCSLMLRGNYRPNLEIFVEDLTSEDLHDLFDLIADRIVQRSKAKLENIAQ